MDLVNGLKQESRGQATEVCLIKAIMIQPMHIAYRCSGLCFPVCLPIIPNANTGFQISLEWQTLQRLGQSSIPSYPFKRRIGPGFNPIQSDLDNVPFKGHLRLSQQCLPWMWSLQARGLAFKTCIADKAWSDWKLCMHCRLHHTPLSTNNDSR